MGEAAASFQVRLGSTRAVIPAVQRALAQAIAQTSAPKAAVLFCSASFGPHLEGLAEALRQYTSNHELVIVGACGPGVLSEKGELESELAVTGMVFGGGRVSLRSVDTDEVCHEQIQYLVESESGRFPPCFLFIRSEGFDPEEMWQARRGTCNPNVFGAGTYGGPGIICIEGGDYQIASAASLRLKGLIPLIRTAHSCRLLSPLMKITRTSGTAVLELDGTPALDVLEDLGNSVAGRPLLFTILSEAASSEPGAELLVRGIHGIDPDKKALVVSSEIREGTYMTFGVRDAMAAREDLQALCRQAQRDLAGAAPRFGLYLNCSGRGQEFHGAPHVDTRVLRERFPGLPISGLHSAFEIAPYFGCPALQLYTGVLVLFSSPS